MKKIIVYGPVNSGRTSLAERIAAENKCSAVGEVTSADSAKRFLEDGAAVGEIHASNALAARNSLARLAGVHDLGEVLFVPAPLAGDIAKAA